MTMGPGVTTLVSLITFRGPLPQKTQKMVKNSVFEAWYSWATLVYSLVQPNLDIEHIKHEIFHWKNLYCAVLNQDIARIHQTLCQKRYSMAWKKFDELLPQFNDIVFKTSSFLVRQFLSSSENLSLYTLLIITGRLQVYLQVKTLHFHIQALPRDI